MRSLRKDKLSEGLQSLYIEVSPFALHLRDIIPSGIVIPSCEGEQLFRLSLPFSSVITRRLWWYGVKNEVVFLLSSSWANLESNIALNQPLLALL